MAKTARAMSHTDIETIVHIIRKMRSKPTWARIEKRAALAGVNYKKRAMQNQILIKSEYSKKVRKIRDERQHQPTALTQKTPRLEKNNILERFYKLQARVNELERENQVMYLEMQRLITRALEHNVPLEELNRPLASL